MKNKNILVYIYLFVLFLCIVFTIKMSSIVHADSLLEKDAMYLRDKMVKRESTVTIEYENATEDIAKDIFLKAIENNDNPTHGDYLAFHTYWSWYYPDIAINKNEITYRINYNDTLSQEGEVSEKVHQILDGLKLDNKSDYEKVCVINDWIVDNIEYEDVSVDNMGSSYTAFIKQSTPCRGFAIAFYRLCKEEGIETRIVYRSDKKHEWNLVKLNNKWYHIDTQANDYSGNKRAIFLVGSDNIVHELHSDFSGLDISKEDYNSNSDDSTENKHTEEDVTTEIDNEVVNDPTTEENAEDTTTTEVEIETTATIQPTEDDESTNTTTESSQVTTELPTTEIATDIESTTEQQIATESTTEKQEQAKPAKTKIVSMYNISGGIHLTWKKVSDVKYVVYRKSSVSKCYKKVKTTTDSTYEDRNVINGRKYTYKIYTVNSNDMKNVSSSKSIVYVSPTKINKVTSSSTSVCVKFSKVSAVSGYQVKYSPNGEFTNYKLKTIRGYNNTSCKIKGLRSNAMYYIKVRTYRTVSGKTYYSGWGYYKYIKTQK